MSNITILIYGIIQGLGEFLPISSSAHLALLPKFMDFKDPGVIFDLLMHLGTAVAIVVYFWRELVRLAKQVYSILITRSLKGNWFALNFILATFVSVIFIFMLKDLSEEIGRSKELIAFNLIAFGIIMWLADLRSSKSFNMSESRDKSRAGFIGFAQALAIFPGVSRSGITLTAARLGRLGRKEAGEFSFLLSLPIIFAGILYKAPEILKGSETYVALDQIFLGVLVSFVVGLLTIHFFLKFIKRIGLLPFAVYRVVLGLLVYAYL